MEVLLEPNKDYLGDFNSELNKYLLKDDRNKIEKAYQLAKAQHKGQFRRSGEEYITHPVIVATYIAKLRLDANAIIGALLHDCVEDTNLSIEKVKDIFGENVSHLVDGVTKFKELQKLSQIEQQAENFRKLLFATNKDIRVIIIKLSDRLHNMQTIHFLSSEKRKKISRETLYLHAPIACRLGLNGIKQELENLSFKYLNPLRYGVITKYMDENMKNREKLLNKFRKAIFKRLKEENIKVKVKARIKDTYGIYKKMKQKKTRFKDILDIYGCRVIADKQDNCYRILGILHNLYKPVPGKFKDYIAIPKENGYQSLHTILFGISNTRIEVQIRTLDMDIVAEYGVASHWHYKSGSKDIIPDQWLQSLMHIQKLSANNLDFIEEAKRNLFLNKVFVFTPQGKIIQLPEKSTILDFAYAIHTDVGNSAIGGKVNNVIKTLSTTLRSGQIVEIITDKNSMPKTSWLKFAYTSKARMSITHTLQNAEQKNIIRTGYFLLKSALKNIGYKYEDVTNEQWEKSCKSFKLDKNAIISRIGLGDFLSVSVVNSLFSDYTNLDKAKIKIKGSYGMVINFSHCCYPIYGDEVIGIMAAKKGLTIHRIKCANYSKDKNTIDKIIDVEWQYQKDVFFQTGIRCLVDNRDGVLASIINFLSDKKINVENINIDKQSSNVQYLYFFINIKDVKHLNIIIFNIKLLRYVKDVKRI